MKHTISYGKGNISLYRTHAKPLSGLKAIPESPFTGSPSTLFTSDVEVEVFGSVFLPAYTEGDNSNVVATATMTNFILQKARLYTGSTQEGFLHFLASQMLKQYPIMESLRISTRELPFIAAPITNDGGQTVTPSDRTFAANHDSYATVELYVEREGEGGKVTQHDCGRLGMKLVKLTGNAFANFQRDEFTTLPQKNDRLLYIFLDMGWRYLDVADAISDDHSRYISAQQVYDHIQHTFHDFVNMSIQHLVYEMGVRLMARFPQMGEVWFKAQNRLWEVAAEAEGEDAKTYMDPRPPYGMISLKLTRDEL
ncbi:MAG: urate oxidase [Anaerolineae bacterium]|jgi:urate oxidase|nr:urate oxidase [Anaerolineae bacterium]